MPTEKPVMAAVCCLRNPILSSARSRKSNPLRCRITTAWGWYLPTRTRISPSNRKSAINAALEAQGVAVLGWREVPTDPSCLGDLARASLPGFWQVMVAADGNSEQELNRRLFFARRHAEKAIENDGYFYICSLSASVMSYKGLMMPVDLPVFFPDLGDSAMETAIVVFPPALFYQHAAPSGRWPSRSVTWPITVKSTPCRAIVTGHWRGKTSSRMSCFRAWKS